MNTANGAATGNGVPTIRLHEWDDMSEVDALGKFLEEKIEKAVHERIAAARLQEQLDDAPQYVTLDQIAAIVNRSKRTLEKYLAVNHKNRMPDPHKDGIGGSANEWIWEKIRPWLIETFGKQLPERFPSRRG